MSDYDYKRARVKKTLELETAISNVRKDLYEWKPDSKLSINREDASSTRRPVPTTRIKPLQSNFKLKRTNSLKELENSAQKIRPLTGPQTSNKDLDVAENIGDYSWIDLSMRPKTVSNVDRPYLNTDRPSVNSPGPASFRDVSDREADLVAKMNQKDALSVVEMDLSQFKLNVMKNLQKFPNLKVIDFSCNNIRKIENLNFKYLVELKLFANEIQVLENLDNLPELQSLQLQSNRIKTLNKGLMSLKKLEYLRLDRNKLTSISVGEISFCHNLIYLDVSFNKLNSLSFINCLPNLEELLATNLELKQIDDLDPNRCQKLSEIDLSNNQLTDDQLVYLENFSLLMNLGLANNCVKSVKNLSSLKTLRCLDISNNQIEQISDLSSLTELEVLNVSNNLIREITQIESLQKCQELTDLNLKENPVMVDKNNLDIFNLLPNLKTINEVSVSKMDLKLMTQNRQFLNKDDTLFQFDYTKFEQEARIFDERIFKKLDKIKEMLDSMSVNEPQSEFIVNEKKVSRNRTLQSALSYSKQIDDN